MNTPTTISTSDIRHANDAIASLHQLILASALEDKEYDPFKKASQDIINMLFALYPKYLAQPRK